MRTYNSKPKSYIYMDNTTTHPYIFYMYKDLSWIHTQNFTFIWYDYKGFDAQKYSIWFEQQYD